MKINYKNIYLLFFAIGLSACPYKEVYKPVTQSVIIDGLKISPVRLFFNAHKGKVIYDVIYRVTNTTDSIKQTNFANSFLINMTDTLLLEKIFPAHYGTEIPVQDIFKIYPQNDTLIGLTFNDEKKKLTDTIKVILNMSKVVEKIFIYKKAQ